MAIVQEAFVPISQPKIRLWLLALLTFCGTLAIHAFVPALPHAAHDLGASVGAMQMTVSFYILGLAFGQLIYGPVSDHFGRKPVLMTGLIIYTAAGLASVLASKVDILIAVRLLQALGGCAGLVLARAIIRDTSEKEESARRIGLLNLMLTIGPGVAPILGGLIANAFGWRSILLLLCLIGLVCIWLTWWLLPETAALAKKTSVPVLARNYGNLLTSRSFLGYAIGGGCATTSIYAFISAAPFIFIGYLHRPEGEIGIYVAMIIFGASLGNMFSVHFSAFISLPRLLIFANLVSVLAACALLAVVASGYLSVASTVSIMFIFALGAGASQPIAVTEAVSVNPWAIGSASGLYGFFQMAIGAASSALTSIGNNPALATAIILFGAGATAQGAFYIARRPCLCTSGGAQQSRHRNRSTS